MHYQPIIYSINTKTTGTLYVLISISFTLHYMYIINLNCTSILVNSICFLLNISENFPNIYKEKNLNGLRYLLQKKYSEVSFERLFFMKFFRVRPLKSQMQYNERRVVQCTCMVDYDTRISCHVEKQTAIFFFMPFEVFNGP